MVDVVSSATLRAQLDPSGAQQGAQAVKTALTGVTTEADKMSVSLDKAGKNATLTGEGFQRWLSRMDPATRAGNDYSRAMDTLNKYQQAGLVSTGDLAIAHAALKEKFEGSAQSASMWSVIAGRGAMAASSYAGGLGFIGTALVGLGGAWLAAGVAAGAFAIVLEKSTSVAEKHEVEMARLNAQLHATDNASGQTATGIETMALKVAKSTNLTKDSVEAAASALLVYDRVGPQIFERTIRAAADMNAVFGGELSSNVAKLGLALDDPIEGMNRLRRSGLDFSASQKEVITNLEKSGNLLGAQTALIEALEKRMGGTAEATHVGLAGSTHDVSVAWNEFLEHLGQTTHIGSAAAGGLDILSGALYGLDGAIGYVEKKIKQSPGFLALLGWQGGKFNPLGVVQNLAGMAGYGEGDRGLFRPQHGAQGSWDVEPKDRTLADTASAVSGFNAELRLKNAELKKSAIQQAVDAQLDTLAKSLHLDTPGLLALGKKDPQIGKEIAETERLATIQAQGKAAEKVKDTFAQYLQQQQQSVVAAGLSTFEAEKQAAVIKGAQIYQTANNVLARNLVKTYEDAITRVHGYNAGLVEALVTAKQLVAINKNIVEPQQDRAALAGLPDYQRQLPELLQKYLKQYGPVALEHSLPDIVGGYHQDQTIAADDLIAKMQRENSLIGFGHDEQERQKAVLDATLMTHGEIEESQKRQIYNAVAQRQEDQKLAALANSISDRAEGGLESVIFDNKKPAAAAKDFLMGSARDIFKNSIGNPLKESMSGALSGLFGVGKPDGSSASKALFVTMVSPNGASGIPGIGNILTSLTGGGGAANSNGGFLSSLSSLWSSFAGFFDDGGSIGPGQWGIKSGMPEIVSGGTHGVTVTPVPTYANGNGGGSPPIVISHGGNHVTIQGNADQTTIALMHAELDKRDQAFEGRVMAATAKARAGFRGAWAGD